MSKKRKLLIWSGAIAGIVLALTVAIIILGFRYIAADSTQNEIRKIVADKLGGMASYQRVSLAIFPRPGLSFSQVKIIIPETAAVSADEVKIYPELLPLIQREFKLAKIKFEYPDIVLDIEEKSVEHARSKPFSITETIAEITSVRASIRSFAPHLIAEVQQGKLLIRENKRDVITAADISTCLAIVPKGLSISFNANVGRWGHVAAAGEFRGKESSVLINDLSVSTGGSSIFINSAKLRLENLPYLEIESGKATLVLDDIYQRRSWLENIYEPLRQIKTLKGTVSLTALKTIGELFRPAEWQIDATGRLEDIDADFSPLPGPVKITRGQFSIMKNTLSVKNIQGSFFDSVLSASATISGFAQSIDSAEILLNGNVGPKTIQWVSRTFHLPQEQTLRTPLAISGIHIVWQRGLALVVTGTAAVQDGPAMQIDLRSYGRELTIKQLVINDQDSRASIALTYGGNIVDFSFVGSLTEKTLNRLFVRTSFNHGWLKGNFRAHISKKRAGESTATGYLEGAHLIIPLGFADPVTVNHAKLHADKGGLTVEQASLIFGESHFDLLGKIRAAADSLRLDMDISANAINIDDIQKSVSGDKEKNEVKEHALPEKRSSKTPLLQGNIRVRAKSLIWGRYKASKISGNLAFTRKGMRTVINEASLCGIDVPGNIIFADKGINLDFQPTAAGLQLDPSLGCLFGSNLRISGLVDVKATVRAAGESGALLRTLGGKVDIKAKNGCIYSYPLLAKILAFLNVTELLRGKIPDLSAQGLNYNSITVKGDLRSGKLVLQEAIINGTTMQLVGEGEIDLSNEKLNLTVLVAPFKTVDYLVSKIPLVNYVFKDTLISIPLKITGTLGNPDIFVLPPAAVGQGVLGMMVRTLQLPVKIIEPIIPGNKEKIR